MDIISILLVRKVNKFLVSSINIAGGTTTGLSGVNGRPLTAWPSASSAQLGFVGDVVSVNSFILRPLIENNCIPVCASVTADETGQLCYINAKTVARELAAARGADKLNLLIDVGILEDKNDPGSLVKKLDIQGVNKIIDDGKIAGGLNLKVNCCKRSTAQGVNIRLKLMGAYRICCSLRFLLMKELVL